MPLVEPGYHESTLLKVVFVEALALDPGRRRGHLSSRCAGNAALEQACLALLEAHDAASGSDFLSPGANTLPTSPVSGGVEPRGQIAITFEPPDHDLVRPLAQGGFGQVWMARNRHTDRLCAIKVIDRFPEAELEGVRRLQHCIAGHTHLMPIDHVGVSDGRLFCIMPLADNASGAAQVTTPQDYAALSLELWVRRNGAMSEPRAAALGRDIALALEALHTGGLVHGDVKPQNILRTHGRWVLADYSLVGSADDPSARGRSKGYTPEQGAGTPAGDLYALGQVLEFLRSGRHPDHEAAPGVPVGRAWRELIARLTNAEPELRRSARDAAHALGRIAGTSRRRASVAAVLLLVLAIAGMIVLRPQEAGTGRMLAQLYRGEVRAVSLGGVLAQDGPLQRGDLLKIDMDFTREMRCYLVAVSPDGTVTLCHPQTSTSSPGAAKSLSYPGEADLYHQLSEGTGNYAFILIASRDTLPAFDAWMARPTTPQSGVWIRALTASEIDSPVLLRAVEGVCEVQGMSRGVTRRVVGATPMHELLVSLSQAPGVAWVDALVVRVADGETAAP